MAAPVHVILNALAGAPTPEHDERRQHLLDLFQKQDMRPCLSLAHSGTEVSALTHRAVQQGARLVVAGGGDGTINAVASALVGSETVLGVLPLGTLNHFAKDLHIPLDIAEAVHTLSEGHTVPIDVGEVNGHIFLNNSSLGLYPHIVRHRKRQQERLGLGKWPALLWATLIVWRRYPFLHLRLRLDNEEIVRRTPFVFIGNNEYQFDLWNIGGRVCLDAGVLSLYFTRRTSRLGPLSLGLRGLLGLLRHTRDFETLCVKELQIETRTARLLVATDGEISALQTPLHYRIRPGALRVVVPRPVPS